MSDIGIAAVSPPLAASLPPTQLPVRLAPGHLSKPEKVWSSSSTLIVGFYQAAPYSDMFKIFYKKSGSVFGTQVSIPPQSIVGPELAVRQPMPGEVMYFEYEIKKLKPSTQYVVKIKTGDDAPEVKSDKLGTISQEEERTRNNDMQNFKGALVKLGEYDGLVAAYVPESGVFAIRILQMDDLSQSTQLARLASEYSENGLPVQAYTLSQIRFGHWGGEITDSKVVNEAELKWLVARAVQVNDKSDAHAAYEARARLLQSQVDKVTAALEAEWSSKFRRLKIRAVLYFIVAVLLAVVASAGMWAILRSNGQRQRELEGQLAAATGRAQSLQAEMAALQLYKVSLELDIGRRLQAAEQQVSCPAGAAGNGHCNTSDASASDGPSKPGHDRQKPNDDALDSSSSAPKHSGQRGAKQRVRPTGRGGSGSTSTSRQEAHAATKGRRRDTGAGPASKVSRGSQAPGAKRRQGHGRSSSEGIGGVGMRLFAGLAAGQSQMLPEALQEALLRSHNPEAYGFGRPGSTERWGTSRVPDDAPDPWAFIHYVSNQYALHLQEWMKVQLGQAVRSQVNQMLAVNGTSSGGGGGSSGSRNGNSTDHTFKKGRRGNLQASDEGVDDVYYDYVDYEQEAYEGAYAYQ